MRNSIRNSGLSVLGRGEANKSPMSPGISSPSGMERFMSRNNRSLSSQVTSKLNHQHMSLENKITEKMNKDVIPEEQPEAEFEVSDSNQKLSKKK